MDTNEPKNRSDAVNKSALRNIRARVFEVKKQAGKEPEPGKSQKLEDDPLTALVEKGLVIEPPFDLLALAMLPEQNSELTPCLEAMEKNIEGFGFRVIERIDLPVPREGEPEDIKNLRIAVKKERVYLENFFTYVCLEESFVEFRTKLRKDMESTGNGYFEVIRNAARKITGFTHLPSYQMRLGLIDLEPIKVEMPIVEMSDDGSVHLSKLPVWRKFRRYVQGRYGLAFGTGYQGAYQMRWFKQFGDPRVFDCETGQEVPPDKVKDFPQDKQANEVVHFKLYSPRSPYGLPRFIGNLLAIFGDRAAEEINYTTFRNNNIPSMLLLVSNGQLTEGTIKRIESFVESTIQGSDNYSKFLLLEAEGLMEGEDGGQVKLDVKPLSSQQHKDALFQNYSQNNQDRIRRAFRLPPIFVGRSDDYTRATADSSRRLADEQIFAPEREVFDSFMNRIMFPAMGVVFHKFKSNSPNTTDNTELVGILSNAEKTGGMTPRIARLVLQDILGSELPPFKTEDFDPDLPFSLTMAEAVKNLAQPTEVGQQVTALKVMEKFLESNQGQAVSEEELVEKLLRFRKRLEEHWRKELYHRVDESESGTEE